MSDRNNPSGLAGGLFGIVIFLIGVALLGLSFKLAYNLFMVDPATRFQIGGPNQPLDFGKAVPTLLGLLVQVLLLLVMSIVGGMIANRGIRLYADAKGKVVRPEKGS